MEACSRATLWVCMDRRDVYVCIIDIFNIERESKPMKYLLGIIDGSTIAERLSNRAQ